jgi:PST family polysaccharide transporter
MSSHRQIFKSTALIGGTQIINMVIGILRTKVLAVLLGPTGIGLAGLYVSATSLIGSVAGLGINASGVRQIAEAAGTNDEERIARTIVTLHRVSLFSGLLGMVLILVLAPLLSRTTFGDDKHVMGIALMSLTLLFGGISAGQSALLQGLRRLRDLAASQIIGTLFGAVVSVALVWHFREQGIIPYLVAVSAFGILLSWWYARKVEVLPVRVTWRESFLESRSLLAMGIAFTAAALIGSGTAYLARVLVQHQLGTAAVGIYTATWTLSTYYIGFVLSAMGADFMPRLTASSQDNPTMNRLVNEQTEMGILIALPGVIATLTLAPWVMKAFYSAAFMEGADVARWQILGVFLRVVSWPLGYILIAKGESLRFTVSELVFGIINVASIFLCMKVWKLDGVGISFAISYLAYTVMMVWVASRLTGFRWSPVAWKILIPSVLILSAILCCTQYLSYQWSIIIGMTATVMVGAACLVALQKLLGIDLIGKLRAKFTATRS